MQDYEPPADLGEASAPAKKAKKDPNAPKRGKSAYIFFCDKIRAELKEQNPEAKTSDLMKLMGEKWKTLGPSFRLSSHLGECASNQGY